MNNQETNKIINQLFNNNKISDLKQFINQRSCLNTSNQYLTYLFYFFQASGVFSVSLGQAYNNPYLSWGGVGLNSLASFIYIVINSNSKINTQLMQNIQSIFTGDYIDEGTIEAISRKESTNNIKIVTEV
jgi:hypothetical protein